jgi:hypothetical protein
MPAFASLLEEERTLNVCLQTQNRSGPVSLRTESVSAKLIHSYGTREKRKCPLGTRSFLSWSPMRRTAVLSLAAAAALGHEF